MCPYSAPKRSQTHVVERLPTYVQERAKHAKWEEKCRKQRQKQEKEEKKREQKERK